MAFLYSHLLTPFVLSSMYNWTQMTSGRLTHWQRAVKQRSNNDSASFLSGQAAPCIGISLSSDIFSFDFYHQNISLSKHLFIGESSWRPQNISLQSFWHIARFQHDQKMRHFWLISAAHRPLIDQDDLIVLVMHCDAVWCTVMHCDAVSKRQPTNAMCDVQYAMCCNLQCAAICNNV